MSNADKLIVDREKVVDYLLNPLHRYGASKARFFFRLGFGVEDWRRLAHACIEHGRRHEVVAEIPTPFGPRYVVEGSLESPDGRSPLIRTVWQFDRGRMLKLNRNDLIDAQ